MLITKNITSKKTSISVVLASLLMLSQGLIAVQNASAEVIDRTHGVCKKSVNDTNTFEGHCTVKHKRANNGDEVVVLELDNGEQYKFRGANTNSLQVESWDGIHDVKHKVEDDKEVFVWTVGGDSRNRLVARMDTRHPANPSVNNSSDASAGVLIGTVVGGLIGALIGGSSNNSSSSKNTPSNLYGQTPRNLQDLVGAKAGQAEGQLKSRGYSYRNTQEWDGGKTSYYVENNTGYCVEVGTVEGRYSTIVYNSSDRCR
jgi:hypothetical protein